MPRMPAKKHIKPPGRRVANVRSAPPEVATHAVRPAGAYVIKDKVSHVRFGDGIVTAVDGEKLTIKFADGREKQILDYYLKRRGK